MGSAEWVQLSGILILTHNGSARSVGMVVNFRENGGSRDCEAGYTAQIAAQQTPEGRRSPWTGIVPVKNGKIEFCYYIDDKTDDGGAGLQSAYGANIQLQGFGY